MGIQTRSGNGNGAGLDLVNINLKEGCYQSGSKSGNTFVKYDQFTDVVGIPFKFDIEPDEYEGQKSLKARLFLHDVDPAKKATCVIFTVWTEGSDVSSGGIGILAKLYAAAKGEQLCITPWHAPKGTKMGNYVVESEGGQSGVTVSNIDANGEKHKLLADYLGQGDQLPKAIEVKVGSKIVLDKSAWTPILEGLTAACYEKFNKAKPQGEAQPGVSEGVSPEDLAAAQAAAAPSVNVPAIARDSMRARA